MKLSPIPENSCLGESVTKLIHTQRLSEHADDAIKQRRHPANFLAQQVHTKRTCVCLCAEWKGVTG